MSGARADTQPGTNVPVGPTRTQPETNNQKEFADQLNISQQIPLGATKGEASDIISDNLNKGSGAGSGAAKDITPGSTIPTGPSADQNATQNQKAFMGRLGEEDKITPDLTKGEASEIISNAKESGATNASGGAATSTSGSGSSKSSGAAQDTTPGNPVPTGPSANQPATTNQKTLINSLGAGDQLSADATKGDASNLINKVQGNQ